MSLKSYFDTIDLDPIIGAYVILIAGPILLIALMCLPCEESQMNREW